MSVSIHVEDSDWFFPNLTVTDAFNQYDETHLNKNARVYVTGLWNIEYKSKHFILQSRHDEIVKRLKEDHESRLKCSIQFLIFLFFIFSVLLYIVAIQSL